MAKHEGVEKIVGHPEDGGGDAVQDGLLLRVAVTFKSVFQEVPVILVEGLPLEGILVPGGLLQEPLKVLQRVEKSALPVFVADPFIQPLYIPRGSY
ncbi:MAG: hypothetical protein MZV64_11625 [Ignavibacteriales bacterium]|nr:hypothetical protein [Ignavibacteriales bacterium]